MDAFDKEISTANPAISTLKLLKQSLPSKKSSKKASKKKKYIFVGDSDINRGGNFLLRNEHITVGIELYTFRSKVVTARTPFAIDPNINYDLDTDEEYEELV